MLSQAAQQGALPQEDLDKAIAIAREAQVDQDAKVTKAKESGLELFGYAKYDDELVYLMDIDGSNGLVEYGYGYYAVPLTELTYVADPNMDLPPYEGSE